MPINLDRINHLWDQVLAQNPRFDPPELLTAIDLATGEGPAIFGATLAEIDQAAVEAREMLEGLSAQIESLYESPDKHAYLLTALSFLYARYQFLSALYEGMGVSHNHVWQDLDRLRRVLLSAKGALGKIEQGKKIPANQAMAARIFSDRLPFQFVDGAPPVRPLKSEPLQRPLPAGIHRSLFDAPLVEETEAWRRILKTEAAKKPRRALLFVGPGTPVYDSSPFLKKDGLKGMGGGNGGGAVNLWREGGLVFADENTLRQLDPRDVLMAEPAETDKQVVEEMVSAEVDGFGEEGEKVERVAESRGVLSHPLGGPLISGGTTPRPVLRVIRGGR
ncbi:MAG: hypothetical protein HY541_03920 [Deltaproteobacteria bacterium]|nr:hypothetical protein [Deltaproteobacteria bacterium]